MAQSENELYVSACVLGTGLAIKVHEDIEYAKKDGRAIDDWVADVEAT